jgi:SOS-response transcriptional repressor LexA
MTKPLTDRQRAALNFITSFSKANDYQPSYREIGEAIGLKSVSSVDYQLSQLEAKGYLRRTLGNQRAVRLKQPTVPTFDEWLAAGVEAGYASPQVCLTHDGHPTTRAEDEEFEEGGDPCLFIVRPYPSAEVRAEVEDNYSPAQWRKEATV